MTHLQGDERARYVRDMFAGIAGRYDRMNRVMTFGQDIRWRKVVIDLANLPDDGRFLDMATGTGDIAAEGLIRHPGILSVGGDFTVEMMEVGRDDYPDRKEIRWVGADALNLPFPNQYFDAVASGFLMRNVIDVSRALEEQWRVTKPGGRIVILETSPPKDNLLKPFIMIHLNYVMPLLGRIIAGNSEAYTYLPSSTKAFQSPEGLAESMREVGFQDVSYQLFMFGTIGIHVGQKPV